MEDAGIRGVIVDLALPWRPEPELEPDERGRQRDRVEAAQDEVLAALGTHGELRRRLSGTAQLAVGVDGAGRRILAAHPCVVTVHEDVADPPDSTDSAG